MPLRNHICPDPQAVAVAMVLSQIDGSSLPVRAMRGRRSAWREQLRVFFSVAAAYPLGSRPKPVIVRDNLVPAGE